MLLQVANTPPLFQPDRAEFGTCTPEYPEGLPVNGLGPQGDVSTQHNIRTWRATEAPGPWEGHPLGFGVLSTYPRVCAPVFGSADRPSCMQPTDGPGPAILGTYLPSVGSYKNPPSAAIGRSMRNSDVSPPQVFPVPCT